MTVPHRVLRNCLLVLLIALLSGVASGQEQVPAQNPSAEHSKAEAQKCTLSGMVVSTVGGAPVRKATVRLFPERAGSYEQVQSTITDAAGHFVFGDLAAGRYALMVSHPSFVSSQGLTQLGRSTTTYTLAPGQEVKDAIVRLTPGAVLRGRVIDEDGDPVPRAQIQVLRASTSGLVGRDARQRAMQLHAGGAATDDQGEFRVFSLVPGRYYVEAVPEMDGARPTRKADARVYVLTFYPAAASKDAATAVDLHGGDEVSVNIALMRANLYPVTGIVRNAKGEAVANAMVMAAQPSARASDAQVRDGKFEMWLPAGHYSLQVIGIPEDGLSQGQQPPTAHKVIDVPEGGLRDVEFVLGPRKAAAQVTGRVRPEGGVLPEGHQLFVVLRPMPLPKSDAEEEDDMFGEQGNGGGFAQIKPDGTFEMKDVAAGTYELVIGAQRSGLEDWYTKSVFVGTRDELNRGITVSGAPLQLDVVISAKGGTAEGTVKDHDDHPASSATVVVVPDAARSRRQSLYETETTDQSGHFSIRGLEPGEYTVYAWDKPEGTPWFDADMMKRHKDDGVRVTVRGGEKAQAEVHVIPADEQN
jgi:uncharacterized protein (DUF2141 family)